MSQGNPDRSKDNPHKVGPEKKKHLEDFVPVEDPVLGGEDLFFQVPTLISVHLIIDIFGFTLLAISFRLSVIIFNNKVLADGYSMTAESNIQKLIISGWILIKMIKRNILNIIVLCP